MRRWVLGFTAAAHQCCNTKTRDDDIIPTRKYGLCSASFITLLLPYCLKGWGDARTTDGVHFTPQGNQYFFKRFMEVVEDAYPHLKVEQLPVHFPSWDTINPEAPASSLLP